MTLLFNEEQHRYWYQEKPDLKLTSVTSLLKYYTEKFDKEKKAKAYAKKNKRTVEDVLAEWEEAGRKGRERGTKYHLYREEKEYKNANVHRHPILNSYKQGFDLDNLSPGIYPELLLDHPFYGLVGTGDRVEIFENREFDLSDYKTSKKIEFTGFPVYDKRTGKRYPKKMKSPVAHLDDCDGMKFTLQLSLYAFFLEERGYKLRNMWVEHILFDQEEAINIVKYPLNFLRQEAYHICEHFKHLHRHE